MDSVCTDGRGKNATQLRRFNERLVLRALRRMGEASKADLARFAGLTSAAVGGIVASLQDQNLIHHAGKRQGQRGQPATMLQLNARGVYGIGVRLDRTCIETALIDFDGKVHHRVFRETLLPSPELALTLVQNDIDQMLGILGPRRRQRLSGIGLAMPFNLDCWLRELDLPEQVFQEWTGVHFGQMLEAAVDFPVFLENDGTAACIAELLYGVGRQMDDFLYIYLGPAVGGGVVQRGDCIRGTTGNAADVGLMPVPPSRLPSAPRPRQDWDILLDRASVNTLIRHLRYCDTPVHGRADIEQAVAERTTAFTEWLDDCVRALTPVAWSGRALLDVPTVVLDSDLGGDFIALLQTGLTDSLAANAPESRTAPDIVVGTMGCSAAAVGAASLPIFYTFTPQAPILSTQKEWEGGRP
ncbi:ROK family transcriptional regulator [Desulfovibrio inopinatus]|uniref:ROK family transcriptional regulator n=1 Tax=Desulfovibrio inopinatus TaxID=102109 RepID=UPI0003FB0401|nr:ROK family transcriptional regulator [Desulfovibrio inopinatus]